MGPFELLRPAKEVPTTSWSAEDPMTIKPRLKTLVILVIGLWVFGTGDAILIAAGIGNTPWTVLAEGIAINIDWSVGQATFLVSVLVLLLWIPLKEVPGFGTLSNAVLIAVAIDVMTPLLIPPEDSVIRYLQLIVGVVLIGVGSGFYLTANLGPGPRDGLMTGLHRLTQKPIGWVRAGLEITVLCAGWLLGGTVGVGTVVFALGVGYAVALSLSLVKRISATKLT